MADMFGDLVSEEAGKQDDAVYERKVDFYPWSNREVLQKEKG